MDFFIILSTFMMTIYLVESEKFSAHLPMEAVPSFYDIKLNVKLDGVFKFDGELSITITVPKPTQILTLHAKDLKIEPSASVTLSDNPEAIGSLSPIDDQTDFVKIMLSKTLSPQQTYVLNLKYSGNIGIEPFGLFRTESIDKDGNTVLAATTLETTGARQVFPCWDEPSIKANFKVSITCDAKYTVISNTPELMSSINPTNSQQKTTVFSTTPKMSTYLLAFVIGNFDIVQSQVEPRLQLITRRGFSNYGQYALKIGEKALKELEIYTNLNYTKMGNKKMDFVALPVINTAGTENWGLITYKENEIFIVKNSREKEIEFAVTLVAHKLSNQWFGNLVTCQRWGYLWLNEGFATYFQYIIANKLEPSWRIMEKMVVNTLQANAFMLDSLITSVPLVINIQNADNIIPAFKSLSYKKGSAIIRMISHVMGEDKFQTAIQQYLKANQYSAVIPLQLFKELVKVTPLPNFEAILKNWVTTPGFAVVNVVRDYTNNQATISHSRFIYQRHTLENTTYYIPINYVTEDKLDFTDTKPTMWLNPLNLTQEVNHLHAEKFILFNKQQFGYYRVNYDKKNWRLITNFLVQNFPKIHVLNRAQLIDDSFNLARASLLDYSVPLNLAKYLKEETDYIPWFAAINAASYIDSMLTDSKSLKEFRAFMLGLMDKVVKSVGFEEKPTDDHVTKIKRTMIMQWACTFGSKACLDSVKQTFQQLLTNTREKPISSNIEMIIICNGIRTADEATCDKAFNKYLRSEKPGSIGCLENSNSLLKLLNMMNNSTVIKYPNQVLKSLYTHSNKGRPLAINYIMTNFKQLLNRQHGDYLKYHLETIVSSVKTQLELNSLKEFFKINEKNYPNLIVSLEKAENNINWIKKYEPNFLQFLKPNQSRRHLINIYDNSKNKKYQRENLNIYLKGKFFSFNFTGNLAAEMSINNFEI